MQLNNKIIDLTHSLSAEIPSWNGDCGFNINIDLDYKDCAGPDYFRTHKISTRAGMGTHIKLTLRLCCSQRKYSGC